jgi:hypothetical protein
VNETSSPGLLPQLIDLLRALADSQELLTQRVRSAHLELLGNHPPSDTDSLPGWQTNRSVVSPVGPVLRDRDTLHDGTEMTVGPPRPNDDPIVSSTSAQEGAAVDRSGASPSDRPLVAAAHMEEQSVPTSSVPPERDEDTGQDTAGAARIDRDYNFFDDLDARLADLRRLGNRSGHG